MIFSVEWANSPLLVANLTRDIFLPPSYISAMILYLTMVFSMLTGKFLIWKQDSTSKQVSSEVGSASHPRCVGLILTVLFPRKTIMMTGKMTRSGCVLTGDCSLTEPSDDINDWPGPENDHRVTLVGAHQDVAVVVEVHVQPAWQGITECLQWRPGDVLSMNDLRGFCSYSIGYTVAYD